MQYRYIFLLEEFRAGFDDSVERNDVQESTVENTDIKKEIENGDGESSIVENKTTTESVNQKLENIDDDKKNKVENVTTVNDGNKETDVKSEDDKNDVVIERNDSGDDKENDKKDDDKELVPESKVEKPLDHDQDRRNPQYIPKGGAFYEHDNRTSLEDVENKDPQDVEKKKKVWKESKESERWLHDWYEESEQTPKSRAEIIETYGYDIRKEEAPPRARRRRKYGRGPDKYDRNWEDEQAYMVKQNAQGRRGKKKSFGKDEFPPLPSNHKKDSSVEKTSPKSPSRKKGEEDNSVQKKNHKIIINHEKPTSGPSNTTIRDDYAPNRNGTQIINSTRKFPIQNNKKMNHKEDHIKPFRQFDKTKGKMNNNFRREPIKTTRTKIINQEESHGVVKNMESNKNYSGDTDVGHLSENFGQMTFHNNKHSTGMRDNRQDSTNEITEQELDSSANRLNPKRYSKNRKGFTGFFPPEEIVEIDPLEIKQMQQQQDQQPKNQHMSLQQQPLNIQSVIRRYPGAYNGNPGYLTSRPIITGIPQQGMSPQGLQQALSPQGIPQQALSPQVPGLQAIELQQGPMPPQPNFVPPMYIDIDPHTYGASELMGPYTGYAPYSANQPGEMYQTSGGITYYHTECQNSNPLRAPPARRQKSAIPIIPPPE
ncbi:Caldesmon, putative [Pediculus humanus corporis]|uniref:Protein CASC3 n=1 Tax=Pediculus humanus subsp. corporis TaxID=121224 RepID=E0VL73_PEDHC|nr:Caldesmon, putative [Pediculus humanus corporis]EEB14129.1 Caldesmon, putative [Pediculus humanus corporis]